MYVAPVSGKHRVSNFCPVDLRDETRCHRQAVGLKGQCQRFNPGKRQRGAEIISAVEHPHLLDESLLKHFATGSLIVRNLACVDLGLANLVDGKSYLLRIKVETG